MGDLNTDYYNKTQFSYLKNTLNLNTDSILNSINVEPKYSYDSSLNLMIKNSVNEKGMYDYIVPINGFAQPTKIECQITPVRALDFSRMYERSLNTKLYNYGDVEISDHFMVQAKLRF